MPKTEQECDSLDVWPGDRVIALTGETLVMNAEGILEAYTPDVTAE